MTVRIWTTTTPAKQRFLSGGTFWFHYQHAWRRMPANPSKSWQCQLSSSRLIGYKLGTQWQELVLVLGMHWAHYKANNRHANPAPVITVVHQKIFFLKATGPRSSLVRKYCSSQCPMRHWLPYLAISSIYTWTFYNSPTAICRWSPDYFTTWTYWGFAPDVTWTAKQNSCMWQLWTLIIITFTIEPRTHMFVLLFVYMCTHCLGVQFLLSP